MNAHLTATMTPSNPPPRQPRCRSSPCANACGGPTSTACWLKLSRSCMSHGSRMSLRSRRANASAGACDFVSTAPAWASSSRSPTSIVTGQRKLLDELMTLSFLSDAANVIIAGPNGLGKTMFAKHIQHQAILRGHTARFTLASDVLHNLAAQDCSTQLTRRLRRYTPPSVLCVDEVGYLSYDSRYADLLFEVITRRYQQRPTVLTTNKSFGEWNPVFPNAACVVTLVDRLVHRSEILNIAGPSYRLKEAQKRAARRKPQRHAKKPKQQSSWNRTICRSWFCRWISRTSPPPS